MTLLGEVSDLYDEYLGMDYYDPYAGDMPYYEPYPVFEAAPVEYFPMLGETPGYEYYDPGYGITDFPDPSMKEPGFLDSLFGAFKEAGTQLIKSPLIPTLLRRDKGSLQYQFPRVPEAPYDRMDGQLHTNYPRKDTGSRPASFGIPGIKGISPMILLAGAGVAIFLMMRGKK